MANIRTILSKWYYQGVTVQLAWDLVDFQICCSERLCPLVGTQHYTLKMGDQRNLSKSVRSAGFLSYSNFHFRVRPTFISWVFT